MKKDSKRKPKKGQPKKRSTTNTSDKIGHKKHAFALTLGIIVILAIIGGAGYGTYKYKGTIASNIGKVTGNFAIVPDSGEKTPEFPFTIKEVPINLQEEEDTLVLTLNSNCESEKGKAVESAETQKEAECEKKINPIQDALDKAEANYEKEKDRYSSCKEDLDTCEEGP